MSSFILSQQVHLGLQLHLVHVGMVHILQGRSGSLVRFTAPHPHRAVLCVWASLPLLLPVPVSCSPKSQVPQIIHNPTGPHLPLRPQCVSAGGYMPMSLLTLPQDHQSSDGTELCQPFSPSCLRCSVFPPKSIIASVAFKSPQLSHPIYPSHLSWISHQSFCRNQVENPHFCLQAQTFVSPTDYIFKQAI